MDSTQQRTSEHGVKNKGDGRMTFEAVLLENGFSVEEAAALIEEFFADEGNDPLPALA